MAACEKNYILMRRLNDKGINLKVDEVSTLRKAEMTLHRWAELECGDGNNYASWAIERDETTRIPYKCIYPHNGDVRRRRIPDREKGALESITRLCQKNGLSFYHQTDPRGAALYISTEPITESNYTNGVCCSQR